MCTTAQLTLTIKTRSRHKRACIVFLLLGFYWFLLLLVCANANAQVSRKGGSFGVAWRVIGPWRVAGSNTLVAAGDTIWPGSLLSPLTGGKQHSITVLLPDGQRILYECFASQDCDRGFRVPALYRKPTSVADELLSRVKSESVHSRRAPSDRKGEEGGGAQDEAVVSLSADGRVEVAGLAARLSDGSYSYELRPIAYPSGKPARGSFDKRGGSVTLRIPSEGLFTVLISDRLNTPRIDLMIAALHQPRYSRITKAFQDVEALLKDWNEDYQGWPVHEFRRFYLRSVMAGGPPASVDGLPSLRAKRASTADVTCEPQFSPTPGVFKTDTQVTIQCGTLGAVIRYTVDGSQPLENASVYRAPIIVKGTALTIKAFASAKGKKDSPVVTGIFRIGD